uniref:Uncharacterized protein LOC102809134 n=1 Tax=Saccoglossus kowalevskii TaxID=10224 RepID=A0ABM0MGI4_SACKO
MKQKNFKKREPSHFRKIKLEVEEWNKKQGIETSIESSVKSRPQISRKQRRKNARKLKKTKKHEYFSGKKGILQNLDSTKGTGKDESVTMPVKSTIEGKKSIMPKTGKKHKKKKKKKK